MNYIFLVFSLSAFVTTHRELSDIANPPIIGVKSNPVKGYSKPAAKGIPMEL